MAPNDDRSGKDARRGPMKIVYAVILVGIVAIIGTAVLTGHGPDEGADTVVHTTN
ncbi:hypothetical protein [Falsirhodobacter algicola]|uniref:Uncharacterized protein n=1 Tax=Falsirhodobacter algicola TaxID=2692330 RepID=A0A8J8MS19_9RHOB|nr:hypothetical protein [Falsirhodobacter algicola]QUS35331.1 hypothetical protein GR316_03005 [Falsirhodobacter algicola]